MWTSFVIVSAIWLIGIVTPYTVHGYIHTLPVLALVAILARAAVERRSID
jgi:hypothetical protein